MAGPSCGGKKMGGKPIPFGKGGKMAGGKR
jgi:hypothetical protein